METLVLGIGNTLLSDEGAGIHVLNALQALHPEPDGVTYLDGGTLSFTLAGAVEDADRLIVIDAAELRQPPGSIACLENEAMDEFLGTAKRSVHEVGLLDLLTIARLTDRLPARRALVAIQPEVFDWGDAPSEAVARAIPAAVSHVVRLMQQWEGESA